jgi:DinB family protein
MMGIKRGGTVEELVRRARKLSPDARPRWGRLSARQMLCHVTDVGRLVLGEIPTRPRDPALAPRAKPLSHFPMKQLVLYFLPWPHGVRGPREAFTTPPGALDEDVKMLEAVLSRFKECEPKDVWPPHPLFGRMSTADWDRLLYRHTNHHFRQFGI